MPKVPDCFQRQPKKLHNITENNGQVLAVAVDNEGGCNVKFTWAKLRGPHILQYGYIIEIYISISLVVSD